MTYIYHEGKYVEGSYGICKSASVKTVEEAKRLKDTKYARHDKVEILEYYIEQEYTKFENAMLGNYEFCLKYIGKWKIQKLRLPSKETKNIALIFEHYPDQIDLMYLDHRIYPIPRWFKKYSNTICIPGRNNYTEYFDHHDDNYVIPDWGQWDIKNDVIVITPEFIKVCKNNYLAQRCLFRRLIEEPLETFKKYQYLITDVQRINISKC